MTRPDDDPAPAWSLVVGANLIVPGLLGWAITSEGGRVGMVFGVAILWVVGLALCRFRQSLRDFLVSGGWIIAILQIVPVLQFMAGAVALGTVGGWDVEDGSQAADRIEAEVRSLLATLLTRQMLLAVTIPLGWFWERVLTRSRPRPT